jgi:putative membrane protein
VFLGFSLFLADLISSYVIRIVVLRNDKIYDSRRTAALSLFCWVLWLFFIIVGTAAAIAFGLSWWVRLSLLGFSAVLMLRFVVFSSTSPTGYGRLLVASILQPFLCIVPFLALWTRIGYLTAADVPMFGLFFILSVAVGLISSSFFLSVLNRIGKQTLGVPSIALLKAFLLNWIMDLNAPFEELLEKLGEEQDVEVSLVGFGTSKPKAIMVVPSVHPGPFKNIGSSPLPSALKAALERQYDCVACVPHGLFGHELDLASQVQNQKVINQVIEAMSFDPSEAKATPFVTVSNGAATACCQIFGRFLFISFTLAPMTTEDLPQELGLIVGQEAKKLGLTCCAVVNAHNSIDETANMEEALGSLKRVTSACLEKAVLQEHLSFSVGAATVMPEEFTLKDGMGPGGITVVVVKAGEQKAAYVVIDGNNMVSGLRESILSALSSLGIGGGEVFTTDTHVVSGVILGKRGYNPVGEAMDHEKLIGYIKRATRAALSDLEQVAGAQCQNMTVPNVRVIGEKQLETLCLLIDRAAQRAKRVAAPIFVTSGLLLMLFLTLL